MNPTKRQLIIGGVLLAAIAVFVVVSITRSRHEASDATTDLNSPAQIAMDECLAKADDPVQDVFVEACKADRTIDKDPEHCDRWSSKKILEFVNKNSNYPKFNEALAAYEEAAMKCSMPASPTPQP